LELGSALKVRIQRKIPEALEAAGASRAVDEETTLGGLSVLEGLTLGRGQLIIYELSAVLTFHNFIIYHHLGSLPK